MTWLLQTLMLFCCSILNAAVIVLFLSGMVAMIMLRTLHKDIARYNQMDDSVRPTFTDCVSQWRFSGIPFNWFASVWCMYVVYRHFPRTFIYSTRHFPTL